MLGKRGEGREWIGLGSKVRHRSADRCRCGPGAHCMACSSQHEDFDGPHESRGGIRFDDCPVIEFCGEASATVRPRLKILGGAAVGDAARFVDAAVLNIVQFKLEGVLAPGETVSDSLSQASVRRASTN